ncbi:MAG: rRNA maturation RNase YbeY [Candidatus Lloydbacteria bacterium]|nr:rRNA maturation RNase YbeY [Candidatus Lloydbacteria bacterium]
MPLSISATLKGNLFMRGLPFHNMKKAVLGDRYSLSLVFAGNARSRALNKKYRGKDKPANVLSFPLGASEGEMFLNPLCAKKDAPSFGVTPQKMLGILFIHGMLHLKGMRHGSTMERAEKKFRKRFSLF